MRFLTVTLCLALIYFCTVGAIRRRGCNNLGFENDGWGRNDNVYSGHDGVYYGDSRQPSLDFKTNAQENQHQPEEDNVGAVVVVDTPIRCPPGQTFHRGMCRIISGRPSS
ncbi:UNVERIFIED_CONTAM: hypothetical protein PYX00_009060 [Menopon gallinae]|uniref:Secreted protein n=1 Tax=Menopon gallinae TaxID=328185 RepID=A0AAW2H9W9_9NEOP